MDRTTVLRGLMEAVEISSFRELCRRAGVSEWAVRQLRGDRITDMRLGTLQKLAAALQIQLTELLSQFGVVKNADSLSTVAASPEASRDRIAALEAEYQRLQTQFEEQESILRQRFQQEVLTTIESWLLQWPTVSHAVAKNPDLPASRVIPLVQPVQNLLTQWGVEAIAPVGSEISYDPSHHQLMNGTAQPGDPVKVRYTGFFRGDTLLHRAKVSPVE
ncbi:MAG: helix-turn-helix domain-containing protein [Leptolyngbyaceae cyanobacterium]